MRPVRSISLIALGLIGSLLPPSPASAAVISPTVFTDDLADNGNCSLREAILSANVDGTQDACPQGSGDDTIVLQAGTYELTREGDGDNFATDGDLDIRSSMTIVGAGPAATIIDGEWLADPDRIFHVLNAGTSLTLQGVTVRDGDLGMSGETGAGVRSEADTTLTLIDAVVSSNSNAGNGGGGIFNLGTMTLERVEITDNVSDCCGGIWHDGGTATLTDVLVARNSATDSNDSGGIFNDATMTLDRVAIIGNDAQFAGGLGGGNPGASLTATNVMISGNSATDDAGGFSAQQGTATLNNVTISGNTSDSDGDGGGDGGGVYEFMSPPQVTIRNTIVAGNVDRGGEAPDCRGQSDDAFSSGGHNLIGNTTGCTFTSGTGDLLNVDPLLGPLANNGGFTQTHALLPGSPAIDAGGSDAATTDQRGLPRTDPDIGAYELVLCKKVPVNHIGTNGNDVLTGTAGADGFLAQDGNDRATGLGGSDAACMGGGKDTASGGGGKDTLLGEAGKDKLKGQGGRDVLKGGPGKDTCTGGGGKDKAACETEKKVP